jgi:hypothetical protein
VVADGVIYATSAIDITPAILQVLEARAPKGAGAAAPAGGAAGAPKPMPKTPAPSPSH